MDLFVAPDEMSGQAAWLFNIVSNYRKNHAGNYELLKVPENCMKIFFSTVIHNSRILKALAGAIYLPERQ
jgi:hypothetical protein